MDETKNTPAIILDRQPYREHDVLVTVYTRDLGKLVLIARGAKKSRSKLAGHIEPLALANILVVRGKGLDYVGSALTQRAHQGIRKDLNKLYYAGQALNLFSRLVKDGQPEENLFLLLSEWLSAFDDFSVSTALSRQDGELFYSFFALKLLAELGYAPAMYTCLICGQKIEPGRNFFAAHGGGVVCGTCFDQKKTAEEDQSNLLTISDNCVKVIRFIMRSNLINKVRISGKLAKELLAVTNAFIKYNF